jgi:hypothetical protein
MANINNPHGLMPLGTSLSGGPQAIQILQKVASNANAIYRYDPVARQADGSIGADSITPGTTLYSGVSLNYGAASTLTDQAVVISPDAIYEVQCDSTAIAAGDMGANANLTLGAGSATTKMSGAVINGGSIATTSTLDLHLLGLFNIVGNAFGAYARIEVVFNKHRMAPGVAGV